jgi:hypothetical protein
MDCSQCTRQSHLASVEQARRKLRPKKLNVSESENEV